MIELLEEYRYVFLFVGLVIAGETVLFPAMYLVFTGVLDFWSVVFVSAAATVAADTAWYFVGRYLPLERLVNLRAYRRNPEFFRKARYLFDRHGLRVVFLSKLVYGTRTIVQIIAGAQRLMFWRYQGVNILGIVLYLLLLFTFALTAEQSLEFLQIRTHKFEIAIGILVVVIVGLHIWSRKFIQRIQLPS